MTRLTERSARYGRAAILTLSIAGLVMVFQPVSLTLFGIGCATVFVAALVFNLMPVLQKGQTPGGILKAVGIMKQGILTSTVFTPPKTAAMVAERSLWKGIWIHSDCTEMTPPSLRLALTSS